MAGTPGVHRSGKLTGRQERYAQFIADGKTPDEAYDLCGYKGGKTRCVTMAQLQNSGRVSEKIRQLIDNKKHKPIADREDREKFWTLIMNDASYPAGARLEASKLLGKSQGDFTISKKIEHSVGNPVVKIPNNSPAEWEKYWENNNEE